MKHAKHSVLNAAYMFYYATDAAFEEGYTYDDEEIDGHAASANGAGPAQAGPSTSTSTSTRSAAQEKAKLGERLNGLVGDIMVVAKNVGFISIPCPGPINRREDDDDDNDDADDIGQL